MYDNTKEQRDQLTKMLEDTLKKWLDEHQLWPSHFMVEDCETHVYEGSDTDRDG